jgi:hypothetical protein
MHTYWQSHRFSILLGLILLFILGWPLSRLSAYPLVVELVGVVLLVAILISAVLAAGPGPRWRFTLTLMGTGVVLLNLSAHSSNAMQLELGFYVLTLIFLGSIAVLTVQYLMRSHRPDYDTLAAALCAYAVLVLFWACAYSLVESVATGSFSYAGEATDVPQVMHLGFGDSMTSIYFSFVTITTLGYGDILPVTAFARMLAALQAFFGQAFVAILVARLVGLQIAESMNKEIS